MEVQAVAGGGDFELSITLGKTVILAGVWTTDLVFNDESLQPVSPWELVCRHRNRSVKYVEASQRWTAGVTLWRHLLLAPRDGWLLVAEAVTAPRDGEWQYRSLIPSTRGSTWRSVPRYTEGWIWAKGRAFCRALPVFASEWKAACSCRPIGIVNGWFQIAGGFAGRAFFAPVWFDLLRSRAGEAVTWRVLTVAEDRQIVPPDQAVAYRVQVGSKHWLLYRTLAPAKKRSFFGHQLVSDLLFARWDPEKDVLPLLELVDVPE
ncbi:MAG: hypothetical protein NZ899_00540 [Thermoguttaceae bacterium]|nr:hypothetical protein [Thermoguttaceae bacterium]MDW8077383.1 hypothetical protein [Thermoguttaceae bacterium]